MKCLVYASRRSSPAPDDLAAIEGTSLRNNARDGLTGALLHDARMFLQMIEGGHDEIARCFLRIAQSPLHREIEVLTFAGRDVRLFGEWSMRMLDAEGRTPSLSTQIRQLRTLPQPARLAETDRLFLSQCG